MSFVSWKQWRNHRKMYLEFVGPKGQPDPSGISALKLQPGMTGPARPTTSTRPGMSMSLEGKSIYDQFLSHLKSKTEDEQINIINRLEKDLGLADKIDSMLSYMSRL